MWTMPLPTLRVVAVLLGLCAVIGFVLGVGGAPERARLPGEAESGPSSAPLVAADALPLDEPEPPKAEEPKEEEEEVKTEEVEPPVEKAPPPVEKAAPPPPPETAPPQEPAPAPVEPPPEETPPF